PNCRSRETSPRYTPPGAILADGACKLLITISKKIVKECERLAELGGTGLDRVRWLCRSGWLTGFGHFCDFGGHLGVKRQLWAEKQARLFAICASRPSIWCWGTGGCLAGGAHAQPL